MERIPRHIAEVIRLKGGNEYREGRVEGDVRLYDSNERANEYIRSYMKHHSCQGISACAGLCVQTSVLCR